MIRIAVVEDDEQQRNYLVECLRRFEQEENISLHITIYQDGVDLVDEYKGQYHILLLDIQMKHMDGMTAAQKIREKDPEVAIVFITNLAQYAIQGYSVEARGYILKPVRYKAFARQLSKICDKIGGESNETLTLQIPSGIRKVPLGEIYYIDSREHYLYFHLPNEEIPVYSSMKAMEAQLAPKGFSRCNHGLLINLRHVQSVQGFEITVGQDRLTISKSRRKRFMEQLTTYLGG